MFFLMPCISLEIIIKGLVQGVGFRPFIFRVAKKYGLTGFVSNREFGVFIKISGDREKIESFLKEIKKASPPLSNITSIETKETTLQIFKDFIINESKKAHYVSTLVSPDISTCDECYQEIIDKKQRRFGYAFTNCTNCGPRYTIIERLPYDRKNTSMKSFKMCTLCEQEFEDPSDRRFHAQPIACPACGPEIYLFNGKEKLNKNVFKEAALALKKGQILAIKGLGGFHLACSAYDSTVIGVLRSRKIRPYKPLAIMVRDLKVARRICLLSSEGEKTLTSMRAPIVVCPKNKTCNISHLVSPNITDVGLMLPYTPIHHLLFREKDCPDALVMTSGNSKDEPLCFKNSQALYKLGAFADLFVLHNRPIVTGIDDSVLRQTNVGTIFFRRARGFVPEPIDLSFDAKQVLAVGAELKNTFCLTKDSRAIVSQHIGDLANESVFSFFKKNIRHLCKLFDIEPELVGADLHPDYLSSRFAADLGLPVIRVQHHFAHAASVMAEHNLESPVIGIILDGTGLGTDGTIWGGEVLIAGHAKFKRVVRLKTFPMPGGESCIREPWRVNLSVSVLSGISDDIIKETIPIEQKKKFDFVLEMIKRGVNSPLSSSCGRLFDAVSSIVGICHKNSHEAQAAMELEASCASHLNGQNIIDTGYFNEFSSERFFKKAKGVDFEIDWSHIINTIYQLKNKGDKAVFFHAFLIWAFSQAALLLSKKYKIKVVVLSGGCFQNRVLLEGFYNYLRKIGLKPYINLKVPPNDGGLSLGQAMVVNKYKEMT